MRIFVLLAFWISSLIASATAHSFDHSAEIALEYVDRAESNLLTGKFEQALDDLEKSYESEESISMQVEILRSDISSRNNPLKGIKEFTVFLPGLSYPAEKKFFIQEIEKLGSAKLFTFTKAPVDYEGMGTGMCLTLNIYKEDILGSSDAGIIGIHLQLNTSVEVAKTKHSCDAHIWETTLFATKDQLMEGSQQLNKF